MVSISANYEYAAACVPSGRSSFRSYCAINIISKAETNIEINTAAESVSHTLLPGLLYQQEIDENMFPILGVENKAVRITSDEEIQVLIYSEFDQSTSRELSDVYLAGEQAHESNRYVTIAYPYTGSYCSASYNKQFYLVATFHNETSLDIEQKDGSTYNVDLPEFGTFVQVTNDPNDHLADGTIITSNKPINVVSGYMCLPNSAGTPEYAGTYISNMPAVTLLGHEYVVPKIIHQDMSPPGYSVSVVATEDNNKCRDWRRS